VFLSFLVLREFRNYEKLDLPLRQGISLFYGINAAGKTNLLEACYYISALSSPRAERDADLARWGQDRFSLAARIENDGGVDLVKVETVLVPSPKRRLTLNDGPAKKQDLHKVLPSVYFSPDDLSIVKRGSYGRRRYLDSLMSRVDPAYPRDLSRYQDAVERRNAALKNLRRDPSWRRTIDTLDEVLVEAGAAVLSRRIALMDRLVARVEETYAFISGESCSVSYVSSIGPLPGFKADGIALCFREALGKAWPRDKERCVTSVGPHRDDIEIGISQRTFRYFGSQGQQRSVALALRMAEARMLEDSFGKKPVLLLDDVFSELDQARRDKVLSLCDFGHQILITSTDPINGFGRDFHLYKVKDGEVAREKEGNTP